MSFRSLNPRYLILIAVMALIAAACDPQPTSLPEITETPEPPPPTTAPTDTPLPPTPVGDIVPDPQWVRITMFDELNGWAIGLSHVMRTADGGETWIDVTMPGVTEVGYGASSFFLDMERGWVLIGSPSDFMTGTLYRTSDGGMNWTSNRVPFGGGPLQFLDRSMGWAMANLGVATGSMAVAIYQTFDGGANWTRNYINDPTMPGASSSLPLSGLKNDLRFLDNASGWVAGVTYAVGETYLYRTTNAGSSWELQVLSLPAGYEDAEISIDRGPIFIDSSDGFLPVRYSGDPGQMVICTTGDAGANWDCTSPPIPDGRKVDFVSATDGIVWNGSEFYLTTDGAQTWTAMRPDTDFGDNFAGMDFVNAATGWVITVDASDQYALYRTTDSGQTWTRLFP